MKEIMQKLTDSQVEFIKIVLGMYITNNIIDGTNQSEVEEYIAGMLAGDEFYYLVNYIVDEVIKEPEWVVFLETNDLKEDSFTVEEWNEIFTEVLKTISYKYLYPNATDVRCEAISDFRKLFDAELIRQADIRKKKEEEEKKKAEEERKKKEAEEAKKKAEEEIKDADAEEIKDSSTQV